MLVISYLDYENPRIFKDVECGYGDVELHEAADIPRHLSIRECLHVLRCYSHERAHRFHKAISGKDKVSYWVAAEDVFPYFESVAEEDGSLYEQQTMEDYVMAKPEPKGAAAKPKNGGEQKEKKPRVSKWDPNAKITMGVDKEGRKYGRDNNPKRGASAERFSKYRDGMTVADALKAGLETGDLNWDTTRKFISIAS